jgi:hypothetical protein
LLRAGDHEAASKIIGQKIFRLDIGQEKPAGRKRAKPVLMH